MKMKILVALAVLSVLPFAGAAPSQQALPIARAANASRTDAQAGDGKGGWLDLGSNDLGVLPAGTLNAAGVSFEISQAGDETAKNCLVLGRKGAESATLALETPVAASRLYLLHAVADAPAPETRTSIGRLVFRYADGSTATCDLLTGRDVSEWTSGRSFENALRGWTDYNFNTQVSLYVSQFKLDEAKVLKEVAFEAAGKGAWMVVAASAGEKTRLKALRGSVEPTGTYKSPEPPASLGRFPGKRPKNVILLIGDGMGQGMARLASYYKHGREDALYFQQLPVAGLCSTFSASSEVTDSAAAGTALATGMKTSNGVVGLLVDAEHDRTHAVPLTSVAARAHAQGLGVAILSSDPISGATPAAFYAHSLERGNSALITAQAAACGYDVLVGAASTESWMLPEDRGGKRKDGRDLIAEVTKAGYAFVRTPDEIAAAPKGARIFGAMKTFGPEESIATTVAAVLARLESQPKGFFMMAECANTDHAGHGNNSSYSVHAVSMVEFMTKAAVEFARKRDDTLVVVTADHDTGHPIVLRGGGTSGRLAIQWSGTGHSKFHVPVYSYGPGAELFEGILDNTDVAKNVARLLNLVGTSVSGDGK